MSARHSLRQCFGSATTLSVTALALLMGCESKVAEPKGAPEAAETASSEAATEAPGSVQLPPGHPPMPAEAPLPRAQKAAFLTWKDPAGWKRAETTSKMRVATYTIEGEAGPAELAVFYFGPGGAGGIEPNVKRWVGQFEGLDESSVKRDKRTANGLTQHIIEVPSGTFRGGMPMAPTEPTTETGMLAAIVEAPKGAHFFKMTGPAKTVAGARAAFFELLDSAKP